ncbi:MAG: L-idonate 5-dehydrogenase [Rhizobiales bacterium]|nr:L-idonate 5-dehydrogenase [Hyphomicrobiales bacterium]MBA69144.1 L-idonate 5-dehydrogenase [Hyphomicrobiales bacterium]
MRAVVIHAPHDLRVDTIAEAPAPGPREVRVRPARGGICGSDLHYFTHGGFGAVRLREAMVLGHEVSGVIDALGSGVEGLQPGDKVAVNPSMPCNECKWCRSGMRNQCSDMRFFGSAMRFPHQQGLFREAVTLPAAQVIRLRPETDLAQAACAEPLAVCLHAVRRAGGLLGARVLVSGAGPIGCLTALAARRAGAAEVIVTDLADAPLAIARALGAHRTINVREGGEALAELAADKGTVDCVFECSGAASAFPTALSVLRPQGQLIMVGLGAEIAFPLGTSVTKEIHLAGAFRFDSEFGLAARLIDDGEVDLAPLITGSFSIAEAESAFAAAMDRNRSMKVQIDFAVS